MELVDKSWMSAFVKQRTLPSSWGIQGVISSNVPIPGISCIRTKSVKELISIQAQVFQNSIPPVFLNRNNTFYFPDPIYENHPKHREWGFIGESLARSGIEVIFYTTNMNAPYIHEVEKSIEKRQLLDKVYKSQSELWRFDHKYFLFEGRCRWIF